MPERILITGGTGFVGSYLMDACHRRYPRAGVFSLGHHPGTDAGTRGGPMAPSLTTVEADITDSQQVRQVIAETRPDLVFHLAGQASVSTSWSDPARILAVNTGGAMQLFEALRKEALAPRVVLAGSGEQYGNVPPEQNPVREDTPFRPTNPYAVSKAAQDLVGYQYAVTCQLPVMRARSFNTFGPGQSDAFVIASFSRQIALIEAGKIEPVLWVGNLTARRDFLPVQDAARAYLAIAECGRPGEAYNIGSGQERSIDSVLHNLIGLARVDITIRQDTARLRPADVPVLVADTTKLRSETSWRPECDFSDALEETLEYWRRTVHAGAAHATEGAH